MRASGYDRVASDWYVEPAWLIDALLDVEPLTGTCWDPACGGGNIPQAVKARGLYCKASDIADRGYGNRVDFFDCDPSLRTAYNWTDNIICNPPYGVIQRWIEHALTLADQKVAILARLALLEGQERRDTLFRTNPPARVWVSSRRPSMPPGGTNIPAKGGAIAYAWFVWDRQYSGPTTLGWLG